MRRSFRLSALVALGFGLSACSTIVEGTSQDIQINTKPVGASCDLIRDGVVIGTVDPTPGKVKVKKTKQNIQVVCEKEGYRQSTQSNKSGFAGATAGNILLGGLVGVAIDAASGAANKYDPEVNIVLEPVEPDQKPMMDKPQEDMKAGKPTS